jgi:succinate dehydrogenase hydrophobic anchor subunit
MSCFFEEEVSKQEGIEEGFTMAQKPYPTKPRMLKVLPLAIFVLLVLTQIGMVAAADESDFEQILKPLTTIYNLVKYAATIIAGLVMLFAGVTYISSGSDPGKREKAKNMVMYVIIGLIVIWAAPFVVDLILGE